MSSAFSVLKNNLLIILAAYQKHCDALSKVVTNKLLYMNIITPEQQEILIAAAREAGQELLKLWPGNKAAQERALEMRSKHDGSPVTEADLRSNKIIIECITKLFPRDVILSEESPFSVEQLAKSERTWVVDPLDGTKSFVKGDDDFSVLIALCVKFKPVFSIMNFPARGRFVMSSLSDGRAGCNGAPIHVSDTKELKPGRIYIRNFECQRPELASPMMDSGEALFRVASGELDGAVIRMTTHQEWDLAAPAAIIEAADGVLTSETGSQIKLGRGLIDFQYVIASNGNIHKQLQELIGLK